MLEAVASSHKDRRKRKENKNSDVLVAERILSLKKDRKDHMRCSISLHIMD
jgi:hypothetical protein